MDTAFKIATAIPVNPHLKDRSKSQHNIISACLEIDQPQLAQSYVDEIDNWRRYLCYAELACYFAENGNSNQTDIYLQSAEKFPDDIEEWRKDRITNQIKRAKNILAISRQDSSTGSPETDKASDDQNSFDDQVKLLDKSIITDGIPALKNGLYSYAGLYGRSYDNIQHRALVEDKIKSAWKDVPVYIKIEILIKLAESAIENDDSGNSLKHLSQANDFLDNNKWQIRYHVSTLIALAESFKRSGEVKKAHGNLCDALKIFNESKDEIFDIYRAGILRQLAEAYCLIGDSSSGLSVYRQAVEEGAANVNSRPRAEDLSATCCSMVVNCVEPDEQLLARINQMFGGFSKPW